MGLSFQRLVGSLIRAWNRRSCSASLTENQYLMRMIPDRTSMRSNSGQERRNSWYSSSVQKPMTRSTPARLYQLRSNRTISPAAGRCATYRWKYHWVFSRSVGAVRATTRQTRGLRLWVMVLMTPPLPAASRPSKTTTTRKPCWRIHSWSLTSSTWRRASSCRYLLLRRRPSLEAPSPSEASVAGGFIIVVSPPARPFFATLTSAQLEDLPKPYHRVYAEPSLRWGAARRILAAPWPCRLPNRARFRR